MTGYDGAMITCSRCAKSVEAMPRPPFPGPLAVEIQNRVCAACWKEWLGAQVNLINEYKLSTIDPSHREALNTQMRTFLNLT